jgi:hypothetical protein
MCGSPVQKNGEMLLAFEWQKVQVFKEELTKMIRSDILQFFQ